MKSERIPSLHDEISFRRGPDRLLETAAYTESALTGFLQRINGLLLRLLARHPRPHPAALPAEDVSDPLPWLGSLLRLTDAAVSLHGVTGARLQTLLPYWQASLDVQQPATLQLLDQALLDAATAAALLAGTAAELAEQWLAPAAASRAGRPDSFAGASAAAGRHWSELLLAAVGELLLHVRRKQALLGRAGSGASRASSPEAAAAHTAAMAALLRLEEKLRAGGEASSFPALLFHSGSLKLLLTMPLAGPAAGSDGADATRGGPADAPNANPPAKPWLRAGSPSRPPKRSKQKKRH